MALIMDKQVIKWVTRENSELFYNAVLPDVSMSYDTPQLMFEETFLDKTPLTFKAGASGTKFDALFLKLPREIRDQIYGLIFGPTRGKIVNTTDSSPRYDRCSIGIALKIPNANAKIDEIISDAPAPSFRDDFYDRDMVMEYMTLNRHMSLESCARRLATIGPLVLQDFQDYYFRHVVLDLKSEHGWDNLDIYPEPAGPHLWLTIRPEFHQFIRHISLDIPIWPNENFGGFCRCIARNLDLDTVMLWVGVSESHADTFFAGQMPECWGKGRKRFNMWEAYIESFRTLRVRKSFELRTFIDASLFTNKETPKEFMSRYKSLAEILYPMFLPNTLRGTPSVDDTMEEYMGISELFEEGNKEVEMVDSDLDSGAALFDN